MSILISLESNVGKKKEKTRFLSMLLFFSDRSSLRHSFFLCHSSWSWTEWKDLQKSKLVTLSFQKLRLQKQEHRFQQWSNQTKRNLISKKPITWIWAYWKRTTTTTLVCFLGLVHIQVATISSFFLWAHSSTAFCRGLKSQQKGLDNKERLLTHLWWGCDFFLTFFFSLR